jgi:hypothetical protein
MPSHLGRVVQVVPYYEGQGQEQVGERERKKIKKKRRRRELTSTGAPDWRSELVEVSSAWR